jgi:hypothetical protein
MAQYASELFVQCIYSPELSYEQLIALEANLKIEANKILEERGGEFIHFEEMGDTLRVQCVFPETRESLFHSVCEELAPLMDGTVEARLLFVDKDLDGLFFYTLSRGEWKEGLIALPAAGPITLALRDKEPV